MPSSLPDRLHLELECVLTEVEVQEASNEMVKALDKIDLNAERLAEFKAKTKAEIALLEGLAGRLRGMVRSRKEMREVLCSVEYDWKQGEKTFVRMDTGEVARVVKITMQERQKEI